MQMVQQIREREKLRLNAAKHFLRRGCFTIISPTPTLFNISCRAFTSSFFGKAFFRKLGNCRIIFFWISYAFVVDPFIVLLDPDPRIGNPELRIRIREVN